VDAILAGFTVGFLAVLAQMFQRRGDANIRREEKEADWARQDARETAERERQEAVAAKAEHAAELLQAEQARQAAKAAEAAELLLAEQAKTLARTDEVARLAAETATSTDVQLSALRTQNDEIHTLVNSDMTAARESDLEQNRISLALMRKVVSIERAGGGEASEGDLAAIERTEKRIDELEAILADRLAQQHLVNGNRPPRPEPKGGNER